jgi:hypothetical protein
MKLPALAQLSTVLLLAAACATAGPGSSAPPSPMPSATTPVTAAPTTTPVAPTVKPTEPPATLESRPTPDADEPPSAALGTSDFAVTGALGTYCWLGEGRGECVDTAGFYKERTPLLEVEAGDELVFSLEEGEFAKWNASYGTDVQAATSLGSGGQDVDPDASAAPPELLTYVEFEAPPPGDWIVEVFVRFPNGGDAFYGWHVVVE